MDETIDIIIRDKIDASISANLKAIEANALAADKNISALSNSINKMSGTNLAAIAKSTIEVSNSIMRVAQAQNISASAMAKITASQNNAALSAQKLATEQARTTAALYNSASARDRAAISAQKLADSDARAAAAAEKAARSIQRKAESDARAEAAALKAANAATASATANAKQAAAADKAAAANARNSKALQNSSTLSSGMSRIGTAIGTVVGASELVKMADAYTTVQNKLQTITDSSGQVDKLTESLFTLANKTRMPIESTVSAFTRFDRALKEMGKSQEESLRMTETVNKVLLVSGATTQEANSHLLQLSQTFNENRLNGQEFNNVASTTPILLDAIAEVMTKISKTGPVTRGELKKLGSEGKISGEIIFEAYKLLETRIDATTGKMTRTTAQGMTQLRNNAIKFIGEFNKVTGVTNAISVSLEFMANNMRAVALAATVLGTAMLMVYGPKMIGYVTRFTLALMANPFGLMAVAIVGVVAALALFSDKITYGTDKVTTLKDIFVATFSVIGSLIKDVASYNEGMWRDYSSNAADANKKVTTDITESTGSWTDAYTDFYATSKTGLAAFATGVAKTIDVLMGAVVGIVVFIARMTGSIFDGIYNKLIGFVNFAIVALNGLMKAGGGAMSFISELSGGPKIDIPQMNIIAQEKGKSMGEIWDQSMADGFGSQGAFQKLLSNIEDKATKIAKEREGTGEAALRGKGTNKQKPPVDTKAQKAAEKRVDTLAKINLHLDNEASRLTMLQPLREQEARFDQISEQLAQKKIKLTQDEEASIRAKIKAIYDGTKIQGEMDRMYQEAQGPIETYNAAMKAGAMLLAQNAISRAQYDQQMAKSTEAYKNAIDPMREEMMALKDQQTLLTYLPKQREIEAKMMELQTRRRKGEITATDEQIAAYREELLVLQQKNAIDAEKNSLMESSVYARDKYINQLKAIKELSADPTSGFTAGDKATAVTGIVSGMGVDTSTMQVDIDSKLAMYANYYSQLEYMRAEKLISEQDYANASAQISMQEFRTKTAAAEQFFSGMAQLQGSNIKALAKMGKAAAITQAIINTYEGATKALAVGGISGIAMAAVVVAQGLSNVAAIRAQGFKNGGHTGFGNPSAEAGVVHKNEYVMTSPTTSRLGLSDLDALQDGRAQIVRNNENAGSSTAQAVAQQVSSNANVRTESKPVAITVVNSLDPSMVGDFLNTPSGEEVILNSIRKNGDIIKGMIN